MGILSTHGAVFFRTCKCCDEININHHKLSGQACRDISKIVLNEKREGGGGIKKNIILMENFPSSPFCNIF